MSKSNRSVFRSSALLSGLVTREQIDRVAAEMQAMAGAGMRARGEISDDELSVRLVEAGLLTSYQADQLKAGRTKFNLGPYIITDWIGQGGMGQVFKAVHEMMGRESAVKVLPLNRTTPAAIQNFTREIRTQAQLDHPNLVRAFDAGHDGNVHYLVTEYVPGTDLRRLVRSRGPLPVRRAATIIMQAAEGLDYAHLRGLIHRDVKPGNILVTPEGMAKVSDLGLAGFIHDAEQEDRPAGKIMGTADYLSPEQITSPLDVGPTSDIYSLGCTLYYAITGKVPFPGGTAQDKARRHCEETPWHPRRFNDEVVEEFVEIIADMMEKDPRLRIQTAAEVAARLEPWASDPSPISSQQMKKSPWLPPPLPWGGPEEDQQETSAESDGELDSAPGEQESVGHMSESTDPAESSAEETLPVRSVRKRLGAPPLMLGRRPAIPRAPGVVIALAISIPLCILAGGVLGFVLRALLE